MLDWLSYLIPEARRLTAAERKRALEQAKQGPLTGGESLTMVIWLLCVFFLVQALQRQSGAEEPLRSALVTNLAIGVPLILIVFVPIQLRRIRRHVNGVLEDRRKR
jgi:hypothetical protein